MIPISNNAKIAIIASNIFYLSVIYTFGVRAINFSIISAMNKKENKFSILILNNLQLNLVFHYIFINYTIHHHCT